MSTTIPIREAIERAEGELLHYTHDNPTLLALAYAALAIAKALEEINDRHRAEPDVRMTHGGDMG